MKTRTLRALLWKDFRINRMILFVGAVLWLVPYIYFLKMKAISSSSSSPNYFQALVDGSLGSMLAFILAIALFGGNALSSERVSRSAAFLAYLPPSRAVVLISKAISAIIPCVLIFGVNLLVFVILHTTGLWHVRLDTVKTITSIPAAAVSVFGVAWAVGFLLKSPAIAASCGIVAPIAIIAAVKYYRGGWWAGFPFQAYCITTLTVGVLGFVVGAFCYLRANPDT